MLLLIGVISGAPCFPRTIVFVIICVAAGGTIMQVGFVYRIADIWDILKAGR